MAQQGIVAQQISASRLVLAAAIWQERTLARRDVRSPPRTQQRAGFSFYLHTQRDTTSSGSSSSGSGGGGATGMAVALEASPTVLWYSGGVFVQNSAPNTATSPQQL